MASLPSASAILTVSAYFKLLLTSLLLYPSLRRCHSSQGQVRSVALVDLHPMALAIAIPPGASVFNCKTPPLPRVSKRLVVVSSTGTPRRVPIPETEKENIRNPQVRDGGRAGSVHSVDFRRPKGSGWASTFCDVVEDVVVWAFDAGVRERKAYLLSGNYAPVEVMDPVKDLPVKGEIPECMNGAFLRIGPNPRFKPVSRYHWFDGDGMIHGLNIENGKASYVARYVKTARFQQNEYYGAEKFAQLGQMSGLRGLFYVGVQMLRMSLGVLDASNGLLNGNTNLVYHNKRLMVLHEVDKPYAMRVLEDGDLQTLGREDYNHKLQHNFTAHPKLDSTTGELFIFAYDIKAPYLTYRIVSKNGVIGEPVPITIPTSILMHDFAITKNYALFMDLPLRQNVKGLLQGEFFYKFDSNQESRIGVLPRYATNESQIQWFKIPTCYIFRNANAWEEGDEVVLTTCRMPDIDLELELEFKKEKAWSFLSKLYEFRMNLKTGEVKQRQLSDLSTEFPIINEVYTGRKTQYVYCGVYDDRNMAIGIAKYDLDKEPLVASTTELKTRGNVVGVFHHGLGCSGSGEATFVPSKPGMDVAEDDGYIIQFVHDENTGKSDAIIIDAKTMAPEPIAIVSLPERVPYGFHSLFVNQEQLKQQA